MLPIQSAHAVLPLARCYHCAFLARLQQLEVLRHRTASWTTRPQRRSFQHASSLNYTTVEHPLKGRRDKPLSRAPKDGRQESGRDADGRTDRQPRGLGSGSHESNTGPSIKRLRLHRDSGRDPAGRRSPSLVAVGAASRRILSLEDRLDALLLQAYRELRDLPLIKTLAEEQNEKPAELFRQLWSRFEKSLKNHPEQGTRTSTLARDKNTADVLADLKETLETGGANKLRQRLRFHFLDSIITPRFPDEVLTSHEKLADLRYPGEWFPSTRTVRRKFHMHVGPTNSGKTYQALKRLEMAKNGVYGGPLRLLAHEVYSRLNAKGLPCFLATGEERRAPLQEHDAADSRTIASCTVEMLPLYAKLDVAVIDEIQMIADESRGWAWTQAVLGIRAKEVHLCGEERTVPLIQQICASLGEELEIHRYERLSPLLAAKTSLHGDLKKLRKGDCVVCFSVVGIHAMKKSIEDETGRRVAVVYGSLPAETRTQQAELFNNPDNDYDILVASDAIGMGLNLAIKRVIFETVAKFNGATFKILDIAQIKQIAGRAGRYRVPQSSSAEGPQQTDPRGFVTTLEDADLAFVQKALGTIPAPLTKAGLVPTSAMVERYAAYFPPETPFSYILQKLWGMTRHLKHYQICDLKDMCWVADVIEHIKPLTVRDRYSFAAIPAGGRLAYRWTDIMPAFAQIIADQRVVDLADIKELPLEALDAEIPSKDDEGAKKAYLEDLEFLHSTLICYMWLSFRFAGLFSQRQLAKHATELTEAKIAEVLNRFSFDQAQRATAALRQKAIELSRQELEQAEEQAQIDVQQSIPLSADTDTDDLGLDELDTESKHPVEADSDLAPLPLHEDDTLTTEDQADEDTASPNTLEVDDASRSHQQDSIDSILQRR